MNSRKTFKKNVLYLGVVQISQYLIPLLTLPYLLRVLGVESYGVLGFATSIFTYVLLFTEYGLSLSATAEVAKYRNCKVNLSRIFWSSVITKCILGVGSCVLLFTILLLFEVESELFVVLVCFLPGVIGNIFYPVWFFQGMGKMEFIALCTVLSKILVLPLLFLLVNTPRDTWVAAFVQNFSIMFSGIIAIYLIYKYKWVSWCRVPVRDLFRFIWDGADVFISTLAVNLYSTTTILFLGILSGSKAVGYFSASYTIVKAIVALFNPILNVMFPEMSVLCNDSKARALNYIEKAIKILGMFSLLIAAGIWLFSETIINIIAGTDYERSVDLLSYLSLVIPLSVMNNLLGVQTLLPLGQKVLFRKTLIAGAFASVVSSPFLCHRYGEFGAAGAIVFVELLVFVMLVFHNIKLRGR